MKIKHQAVRCAAFIVVIGTNFLTAQAEGQNTTYHHFQVTDSNGKVVSTDPIPPVNPPLWSENVSQKKYKWPAPRDPSIPYFATPVQWVVPPASTNEPFYKHNHCPAITWCENGDLLAIWFSTSGEAGLEMTILASRLRAGADKWDPASEFFKAPNRNMTGSSLFNDEKGTLYHFNGMGPDGVKGWENLALLMRSSTDNGVTWTPARPISTGASYQRRHQVIAGTLKTKAGYVIQICDGTPGGEGPSAIHVSHDDCKTWSDPGGDIRGIHAGVVELNDGKLMAFGRGQVVDGKMPVSISSDLGKTWVYSASPFPPIAGGQRLVLRRLREGPILLVSFSDLAGKKKTTNGLLLKDKNGGTFTGYGMYAALSFDEGKSWPVLKLLTPGKGEYNGGAWTGVFTASPVQAEPAGYLAVTQTPDNMIHLISSGVYYRFNLAWLKEPNDAVPANLQ